MSSRNFFGKGNASEKHPPLGVLKPPKMSWKSGRTTLFEPEVEMMADHATAAVACSNTMTTDNIDSIEDIDDNNNRNKCSPSGRSGDAASVAPTSVMSDNGQDGATSRSGSTRRHFLRISSVMRDARSDIGLDEFSPEGAAVEGGVGVDAVTKQQHRASAHELQIMREVEQAMRKYDTDGDGEINASEIYKIVADVVSARREKRKLRILLLLSLGAVLLLLATTFCASLAVVLLTRKVSSDDNRDALVSASTGNMLHTRAYGGGGMTLVVETDNMSPDMMFEPDELGCFGTVDKGTFQEAYDLAVIDSAPLRIVVFGDSTYEADYEHSDRTLGTGVTEVVFPVETSRLASYPVVRLEDGTESRFVNRRLLMEHEIGEHRRLNSKKGKEKMDTKFLNSCYKKSHKQCRKSAKAMAQEAEREAAEIDPPIVESEPEPSSSLGRAGDETNNKAGNTHGPALPIGLTEYTMGNSDSCATSNDATGTTDSTCSAYGAGTGSGPPLGGRRRQLDQNSATPQPRTLRDSNESAVSLRFQCVYGDDSCRVCYL